MTSPGTFPWPSITHSSKRLSSAPPPLSEVKSSRPRISRQPVPPAGRRSITTTRSSVYGCSWLSRLVEFLLPPFSGMVRHHDDQRWQSPATKWRGFGMDRHRRIGEGRLLGPLVIAAVHVTPRVAADLEALNVRDSKKISDRMIKKLAVD